MYIRIPKSSTQNFGFRAKKWLFEDLQAPNVVYGTGIPRKAPGRSGSIPTFSDTTIGSTGTKTDRFERLRKILCTFEWWYRFIQRDSRTHPAASCGGSKTWAKAFRIVSIVIRDSQRTQRNKNGVFWSTTKKVIQVWVVKQRYFN